ncbi:MULTISPECIES: hypothetical protein [Helicobacter]|uniref:Chemotaxis protein CheX n=1 Tax=Helicobacter ibis TaxID=2962633 RepID=A0ABT4VE85_9HELI|nr:MULTISPECIES: hypothetical protein [Helicobacter]MDA3966364.1 hypothetical protein [Helicobacter sp. WB40]MDA3969022.1 hypothetical protein [Helicobacter ibis]
MIQVIKDAFIQTFEDTLGKTPKFVSGKMLEGYLSSIDIVLEDGSTNTITFVSSKGFLETFGEGMLGEDSFDDLALIDLSQELANLTIGLAKVQAIHRGLNFKIKTPNTYGFGDFKDDGYVALQFDLEGNLCSLFIHN